MAARATSAKPLPKLGRADRIAVLTVGAIAALIAVAWLVAAGTAVAHTLLDHALTLSELTELTPYAPLHGLPGVVAATTDRVDVTLSGVGAGPRALLARGAALSTLSWAAIAGIVANFAWRIFRGDPFTRLVFRSGVVATFVLVIGPFPGAFLTSIGTAEALTPLRDAGAIRFGGTLDLSSWGAAFVVLLVTTAIGIGMRLRRDTEGLV